MIVIVIPAKGGSTRLPNKNMSLINDRPMIDYTIDEARRSTAANAIYVSTDSDEISAHVEALSLQVIRRPESLGGDTPLIDVYRQALAEIDNPDIETLIGLQVDHPDRNVSVDEAHEIFVREGVDFLSSTEADGTTNGAYKIFSRRYLDTDEKNGEFILVDDCTNIHYQEDLDQAAARLKTREA